jgi:hypothetical protein
MAYCFYNGVKLPELPTGVIANYPYCWIRKNDNTQHYDLLFTKILGYYDASLGGIEYGTSSGTTDIVHYRLAYSGAASADGWDSYQTTNTWMALDANRTVMWSNHYIPNGSLSATEMYFDAHEAIPEVDAYQIEKETVVGIADQVRRLCNTEATMTPAVIKSNLEGLNIDLMETYVISTEEEQVIYPDEGYYGFSKITIGAVDTSGGGSGDDRDYTDAGTGSFGQLTDSESYTGNYLYNGISLPPLVKKYGGYEYTYFLIVHQLTENYDRYVLVISTVPWEFRQNQKYLINRDKDVADSTQTSFIFDRKDVGKTNMSWTYSHGPDRTYMNMENEYTVVWANYDILVSGTDDVYYKGSPAIAETSPDATYHPIEVEDTYLISGSKLNALATAVQNATGATNVMTIDGMIAALNNL